jgi:hypothetical protein
MRSLLSAPALAATLGGCVVVPVTHEVYDENCGIVARQMALDVQHVSVFVGGCTNEGCAGLLAAMGAVAAASAVVSGSIVIAGNIVYWFEKRGRCVARPLRRSE